MGVDPVPKPPAAAAPKVAAPPQGPPDPPPPADRPIPAFITTLQGALPGAVTHVSFWVGDWTLIVAADRLLDVARHLHGAGFDFLNDLTAVDWPPRAERFDVVYCLTSIAQKQRVRLKVHAADGQPLPTVTTVWPSANWLEREVWDLFGIVFDGHPDPRRILMWDEFKDFPMRKDYVEPDDYEYEPTPHDDILEKAQRHYPTDLGA